MNPEKTQTFNDIQRQRLKDARENLLYVVIYTPQFRTEYRLLNELIEGIEDLLKIRQ